MRILSTDPVLNDKTWYLDLVLMLDGEPVGIVLPMEPFRTMEQADELKLTKSTINKLHRKYKLTKEEKKHYTDNFRALITRSVKRLL